MIGYNDPDVYFLTNPIGIDSEIQKIQIKFRNDLVWLQTAFGRAFRQEGTYTSQQGEKVPKKYFYPEVYQKGREPISAMPNDNLKSACFFYTNDHGKPVDYKMLSYNSYTYKTSVVFWMNLKKIDPNKDFRFTEELKQDVLDVLRNCTSVVVLEIFENWENVLNNYSQLGNFKQYSDNFKQYLKPPYSGFRIDFNLSFTETNRDCDEN